LAERLDKSYDSTEIEDIFLPYKPRRATRAQAAREAGLEPLAKIIMAQNSSDISRQAKKYVKGTVGSVEAAIAGARDIIAEWVNENEKARSIVRAKFQRSAYITSKVVKGKEQEGVNYETYFDLKEPLRSCTSHRYLAMRRGEEEGFLRVGISIDDDEMIDRLQRMFVRPNATEETDSIVREAVRDGYKRLLRGAVETEIASSMKEKSDESAIQMFSDNVRQILMAPPLQHKRILAIDPGYRTGCKVVALDENGAFIASEVMYPNPPVNDYHGSADLLCYMVDTLGIDAIAVGNGTAGRETERFVRELRLPRKVSVYSVSEQGASIYSASDVAREEFPDFDVTVRGAISIGRRLLDPLAELVKIEPRSMGVGQYQHDVNQTRLKESLDNVVESCVNSVGVNVNTASKQLLSYVSGIGPTLAANIVSYRNENGPFRQRADLMKVSRMGEKAFQQCAGFLRIPGGVNPLDNTGVHPESYPLVEKMAANVKSDVGGIVRNRHLLHSIVLDDFVTKEVGLPT
ncbi:MAG: helix-hairpin-helix domain-containing protein, partial [Duncaniella sp.]|nr:helix-hairpin-helix domain-containing protein [Duncaniella sp.]